MTARRANGGTVVDRTIAALLLLVALAHAVPALAVFGAHRLQVLYGVGDLDANLEVLLRHRALLFAIVAGTLALGALKPAYRRLALVVGWVSVASFVYLGLSATGINPLIHRVALVDTGLCVVLAVATLLGVASARRSA